MLLFSAAIAPLLSISGCTISSTIQPATAAASNVAPTLNLPLSTTVDTAIVTNFGDSITCGFYATPIDGSGYVHSQEGYAGLLDTAIGKPSQNLCRGGDQAADMARLWVYPNTTPQLGSHQLYTVMIGTNDANVCGVAAGCLTNYTSTLAASLAWLALPSAHKVVGSAVTRTTGDWSPDFGFGLVATGPGATLTIPVRQAVSGRSLYLAYRVEDLPSALAGSATISLDGAPVASLSANPATGHLLLTLNGTTDSVFLLTVPLGDVGSHTLSLATTSQSSATFSFLWAGVPSTSYAAVDSAPRVLLGGIPASTSSDLNRSVATYNGIVQQIVSSFVANGLNIKLAPTATALDGSADEMSDELHPNNIGHAKLAQAFAGVL